MYQGLGECLFPAQPTGTITSALQPLNAVPRIHTALVLLLELGSAYLGEDLQGKGLFKHPRGVLWKRREMPGASHSIR